MRSVLALLVATVVSAGRAAAQGPDFTAAIVAEERVALGAEWRFLRGRAEPSGGTLDWTLPGFDDGSWETGRAGIGYGDGDDATVLSDMKGRYSTVYARKAFEVADPDRISTLELSIDFDDGFVAYLNGQEIARANAGPAGSVPGHGDLASGSHEAGTPRTFTISGAGTRFRAGTNVLAAIGLNDELDSSDFSLHPALRTDGPLAEGCPGDVYVAGRDVLVAGTAPAEAAEVRVNGTLAVLDPADGRWSCRAPAPDGGGSLVATALDAAGGVLASLTLRAIPAHALGGELASDVVLSASGSPHLVTGLVTVPEGRLLSIEPGCEILIRPGAGFTVQGRIEALADAGRPIRFTRIPCQENWGSFSFAAKSGPSLFRNCEWSFATGSPGCLTLTGSDLELDGCILRDLDGEGVHAVRCRTRIRSCLTERTREALSLDFGDTVVEGCTVRDTVGKSDLIDVNGDADSTARLSFNHIYNTSDDGIDADGGNIIIEGNVIHGCGDQAMSLVGAGSATVRSNICFGNVHGLSVKDSFQCRADHNTFAFNTATGARAIEKTPGRGGGIIELKDSIIWGNPTALLADGGGSIDATYCDTDGGIVPGDGNFSADPLFADPSTADFRLKEGSPCIGAASDGSDLGALPFGAPPASYLRGDADASWQLNLTDAIAILAHLYLQGPAPPCPEVADANADGSMDISDPVFILFFLFAGGPAPAPEDVLCPD